MEEKEIKLLEALRKNARASLLALSQELQMPSSTIHNKVRKYHGKIIIKHSSLLDFAKLGYTRACLAIKTTPAGRERVLEILSRNSGINNLHKINSGYDFLAELIGETKEIEDFTTELKNVMGVLEVMKFTIIEDVKREVFVPGGKK